MNEFERLKKGLVHWPGTHFLRVLEGGRRNAVALVERDGMILVAKTTRRSASALQWTVKVMKLAEAAGFMVPYPIPSQAGSIVAGGVTLEPFIEGEDVSPGELAGMLGQLEHFHRATRSFPQRPGFASVTELLIQSRGGDVDFEQMPAEVVATCKEAWQVLLAAPNSAVHGDLNPANVLRTPDGKLALLDWDEARRDVSLFDRVAVGGGHGLENTSDKDVARALLAWEVAVSWTIEPDYARAQWQRLQSTV